MLMERIYVVPLLLLYWLIIVVNLFLRFLACFIFKVVSMLGGIGEASSSFLFQL